MLIGYLVIVLIIIHVLINGQSVHKRKRRYLLFTKDTQWGVFITVAIPLHPQTTVSVAWFMEANYYNVDNATYFEPLLGDIAVDGRRGSRSTRDTDHLMTRRRLYTLIETMLEKAGQRLPGPLVISYNFISFPICHKTKQSHLSMCQLYISIGKEYFLHGYPGTPCLLRAICENADENLCHNGLLGDLLHLILTPSTSMSEEEIDDCYYEAEYYGLEANCELYVQDCPENPLENVSKYIDDNF